MGDSNNTVTVSKDVLYGSVIAVLAVLVVLSVFTQGFGIVKATCPVQECPDNGTQQPETAEPAEPAQPEEPAAPDEIPTLSIDIGDLPVMGEESAAVTLIEFSDYQCPYCSKFYNEGEASFISSYVDTGKANFIFMDFPLSFHPNALPAAVTARCAAEQGMFWEMHHKLFDTQSEWSGLADVEETFKGYADDLELDNESFSTCYASEDAIAAIADDFDAGRTIGVQGTPSNFLIVPKENMSEETARATVDSLNQEFGGTSIKLFQNDNEYIVMIPGAYPFEAFEGVLENVN